MKKNQITELISKIRSIVEGNSSLTVGDALKQSYSVDYPVDPGLDAADFARRASRVLGVPIYATSPMVTGSRGDRAITGYCFFNDEVTFRYVDSQRIHVAAIYRLVLDLAGTIYPTEYTERLSAIKQRLYGADDCTIRERQGFTHYRVDFVMSPEQLSCLIDWHTESRTASIESSLFGFDALDFSHFMREISGINSTTNWRIRRNSRDNRSVRLSRYGPELLQRFEPLMPPDYRPSKYTANTYSSVGGEICPGIVRGFDSFEDARECDFNIEKINKNTISIDDEPLEWLSSVSESSELIPLQNKLWLLKTDRLPQRFSGNSLGDHVASGVLNIGSLSKIVWRPHEALTGGGFKMVNVPAGAYLMVEHHEGCENTPEGRRQAISRLKGMSYMTYLAWLSNLYSDYSILAIRDKYSSVANSVTEDDAVLTAQISARPIEFIESAPEPMTSLSRKKREI